MNSIQEKALLVSLSVSQWTARKFDRKATEAVIAAYGTGDAATRTTKAIVAKEHLDTISKLVGKLRTYHYDHTMPYSKGQAILTTELLPEYMAQVQELKSQFEAAVDCFIANYPAMVEEAKIALNGLFSEDDYPSERQLRRKFNMDVDFAPIPEGSSLRISIDAAELAEMRSEIEAKVRDSVSTAMSDLWQRLYDVTAALKERLTPEGGKDKTFRDSLIGNVRDLVDILPKLNFMGDTDLAYLTDEIGRELATLDPQELRENKATRANALAKAGELLAKVSYAKAGGTSIAPAAAPVAEPAAAAAPEPVDQSIEDKLKAAGII